MAMERVGDKTDKEVEGYLCSQESVVLIKKTYFHKEIAGQDNKVSKYIVQIKHLEGEEIVEACGNQAYFSGIKRT